MDKTTFETADPILDEIAEVANALLDSEEMEALRSLLTKLNKAIGNRYLVALHLNVDVFDIEKERCLPLLQTGLGGFDRDQPFLACGDSTEQRYVADGEMVIVPHDRCPLCWEDWDFKFLNPACSHCGAHLGVNVKVLLDTDACPNCEDGEVSMSQLTCPKCGFVVDPSYVTWG
jgi:ribosomal protein S27AE